MAFLLNLLPNAFTWNGDNAYSSTKDHRLDLFFIHLVRSGNISSLYESLQNCFEDHPEDTVRLLLHSRDIRGGKGEREVSYHGWMWLRKNKPFTYMLNLHRLVEVGCYKDLLVLAEMARKNENEKLGDASYIELEMLSETILQDYSKLHSGDKNLTLAAKWAPSEGKKYHKEFLEVCSLVSTDKKQYRQIITELRRHLRIVEQQISSNDWENITFSAVPSRAHKLLKKAFLRHSEKYKEYLQSLVKGESKVNYKALHPHELVKEITTRSIEKEELIVIEKQWECMVEEIRKVGNFNNSIAISDVSGSMNGLPMLVSVALGIMVAQLSTHRQIITFSHDPSFITLKEGSLQEIVHQVMGMPWGMNTNLDAVFKCMLERFDANNFPKQLFIFSDMQFDEAARKDNRTILQRWKTTYLRRRVAFPIIIFWNLNGSISSVPVTKHEEGVFLLSGFSPQLMKAVLTNDITKINSVDLMLMAISKYEVEIFPEERN